MSGTTAFLFLLLSAARPTVVVALDETPAVLAAADAVAEKETRAGHQVQPMQASTLRLTGRPRVQQPDLTALQAKLEKARKLEAFFDDEAASALRQEILLAFAETARPDTALRMVVAEAGLDRLPVLLQEDRKAALRLAREILLHYWDAPLDELRYSPAVHQLFADARRRIASGERLQLVVLSDRPGDVYADARHLGSSPGKLSALLAPGEYRLWLERPDGISLPYPILLDEDPVTVEIDSALDTRISFSSRLVVRCAEDCSEVLAALGKRLAASRVLAVGQPPSTLVDEQSQQKRFRMLDVTVATGAVHQVLIDEVGVEQPKQQKLVAVSAHDPVGRFHPLYLIPFGGGQFAQDRPFFGGTYLALQLGSLGWHLAARDEYASARESSFVTGNERQLLDRVNLTAALLLATVVAGVIEAVVVGLFLDERESETAALRFHPAGQQLGTDEFVGMKP